MTCSRDELECLVYGRLFGVAARSVRSHVELCPVCATRKRQLELEAQGFALLERAEGPPISMPSFESIVARARPSGGTRARQAFRTLPLQRIVPAIVAAAAAMAIYSSDTTSPHRPANTVHAPSYLHGGRSEAPLIPKALAATDNACVEKPEMSIEPLDRHTLDSGETDAPENAPVSIDNSGADECTTLPLTCTY